VSHFHQNDPTVLVASAAAQKTLAASALTIALTLHVTRFRIRQADSQKNNKQFFSEK